MNAGDFDLAVAPDGKAYYYFERVHTELICADLTDDYTDVTGYYSTHFPRKYPPYVREGIAHFSRDGKHYLLSSGTTGYLPNPSEVAVADTWHGPYRVLGNPHVDDMSHTSFHSQVSCIFKVEGKKDLYIACADRWRPMLTHLNYEDYADNFEAVFHPDGGKKMDWSTVERKNREHGIVENIENTDVADYVWLPIRFEGEQPLIDWRDSWKLEEFE